MAGELAKRSRAHADPAENAGSTPRTHMLPHSGMYLQFQGIEHLLLASEDTRHMHGELPYIQEKH